MPKAVALKVRKPIVPDEVQLIQDFHAGMPEWPEIRWNNFDVYEAPLPDADIGYGHPIVVEDPLPKPKAVVKLEVEDKAAEYRSKCVDLFKKELGSTMPSRWVTASAKGGYHAFPAEICHAQFNRDIPNDVMLLASNFGGLPDMEEADYAYWQFMTGPLSPWRCLFEHGVPEKLFYENGRQSGFIMNNVDIIDKKKTTLVYNFLIAMRMSHEYPHTIQAWYDFVKLGLDGIEALYLCRMYQPLAKMPKVVTRHQSNNGCHWPLSYHQVDYGGRAGYINFDRLYEGNPTFAGRSCGQWVDPLKRDEVPADYTSKIPMKTVMQGVFARVQGTPVDELIVEYRAWMKDYRDKFNEKMKGKKND